MARVGSQAVNDLTDELKKLSKMSQDHHKTFKGFMRLFGHFTKSQNTLIIGQNGAGKSTILDALCFVLFGKPFRKINKPQLLNSINSRDAIVEIESRDGAW